MDPNYPLFTYGSGDNNAEDNEAFRRDKMDTYKLLVAINDTIMKAIGLEQQSRKQVSES